VFTMRVFVTSGFRESSCCTRWKTVNPEVAHSSPVEPVIKSMILDSPARRSGA